MDVVSQRTCAVMVHHTDIAAMDKDEATQKQRRVTHLGMRFWAMKTKFTN
jgi:hypothetical protein